MLFILKQFVDKVFFYLAVDKDKNGEISREEMSAYIRSYQTEDSPEDVSLF